MMFPALHFLILQKLNLFLTLGDKVVGVVVLKFYPFLNFCITGVLLIIFFFFSSMGTAVLHVFVQLLIEKLEFQLLDALITNCA